MDVVKINKVLSNHSRLNILNWLKEPSSNFPPQPVIGHFDLGVCGQSIKEKSKLSQSTISAYMADLLDIGFVEASRVGKWTYFKRNEQQIAAYLNTLKQVL